jgi:chaperonin cofactor prefoldin
MLALRSQNQDLSERAVDDGRRLAQLESSIERLETSVQSYQDERTRLEAAYKELQANLPGAAQPLADSSETTIRP